MTLTDMQRQRIIDGFRSQVNELAPKRRAEWVELVRCENGGTLPPDIKPWWNSCDKGEQDIWRAGVEGEILILLTKSAQTMAQERIQSYCSPWGGNLGKPKH
jgi:hypothetical protein